MRDSSMVRLPLRPRRFCLQIPGAISCVLSKTAEERPQFLLPDRPMTTLNHEDSTPILPRFQDGRLSSSIDDAVFSMGRNYPGRMPSPIYSSDGIRRPCSANFDPSGHVEIDNRHSDDNEIPSMTPPSQRAWRENQKQMENSRRSFGRIHWNDSCPSSHDGNN